MKYRAFLLGLALSLAAMGCASGTGVNPRNADGGRDAASSDEDASTPVEDAGSVCVPVCAGGAVCVSGVCQAGGGDQDHDGVLTAMDCNDNDASVGSTSERPCTSGCGTGVSHCTDGTWGACTAPTTCDCTTGEPPRTIACAHCGMQRQVCTAGVWTDDGLCTGSGPCALGDMDRGMGCGTMCGMQTRVCEADCTWGAWACMGEGVCNAGATQSGDQACGTCGTGTQSHSRTCNATTCQWDAYSAWNTCSGGTSGVCTPGATDTGTQACPGGCANQTRSRSCTGAMCTWGAWGAWSTCPTCGPVCGNGTCESGENCGNCASDCRYGHQGTGHGGDSCAGVPAETWRCVSGNGVCGTGSVSQVCRNNAWLNFMCSPSNCAACFCHSSSACSQ